MTPVTADPFRPNMTDAAVADIWTSAFQNPSRLFRFITEDAERLVDVIEHLYVATIVRGETRTKELRLGFRPAHIFARDGVLHAPLPNVMLGIKAHTQADAEKRVGALMRCPAAYRLVVLEPLREPIDLERTGWRNINNPSSPRSPRRRPHIDGVVAAGDRGDDAAPLHPGWVRSLRDQCSQARVPLTFRGWGTWGPRRTEGAEQFDFAATDPYGPATVFRSGSRHTGRLVDGRVIDQVEKRFRP